MNDAYLEITPEIKNAIDTNLPVVALESTIISHGMPWPKNIETAMAVEEAVRQEGAIPATIAILNGICKVGLSSEDLTFMGKEKNIWKVSLRDMPYIISQKLPGATTVAATMRIASLAGIRIFATGGIGGVHRGAEKSMDISADLTEMTTTNVAIVSAGVKSILDIGLTLEYLETKGIPVITFGQDEFPCFYSSKSGFTSPLRMDSITDIAKTCLIKWKMGLNGSILIANPLSSEKEVTANEIEKHITSALQQAEQSNIKGKDITPFLLKYIASQTNGESLDANISLIIQNASLAAKIAVAMKQIQ